MPRLQSRVRRGRARCATPAHRRGCRHRRRYAGRRGDEPCLAAARVDDQPPHRHPTLHAARGCAWRGASRGFSPRWCRYFKMCKTSVTQVGKRDIGKSPRKATVKTCVTVFARRSECGAAHGLGRCRRPTCQHRRLDARYSPCLTSSKSCRPSQRPWKRLWSLRARSGVPLGYARPRAGTCSSVIRRAR